MKVVFLIVLLALAGSAGFWIGRYHNLLYIVAIATCYPDIPEDRCSHILAEDFDRFWVYRSTHKLCIEFAEDVIAERRLDETGRFAKVYCIRAEPFHRAKTSILR